MAQTAAPVPVLQPRPPCGPSPRRPTTPSKRTGGPTDAIPMVMLPKRRLPSAKILTPRSLPPLEQEALLAPLSARLKTDAPAMLEDDCLRTARDGRRTPRATSKGRDRVRQPAPAASLPGSFPAKDSHAAPSSTGYPATLAGAWEQAPPEEAPAPRPPSARRRSGSRKAKAGNRSGGDDLCLDDGNDGASHTPGGLNLTRRCQVSSGGRSFFRWQFRKRRPPVQEKYALQEED